MAGELKDGIFSAVLRAGGGTFASPSSLSEIDLLTETINIPWEITSTPSNSRKTRNGPRVIDGASNLGTAFEIQVEDDPDDTNIVALKAAVTSKAEVILLICPYLSAANTPPTDVPYIKGKYRVYGGSPSYVPGKPNAVMFRFAVHLTCADAPTLVTPA